MPAGISATAAASTPAAADAAGAEAAGADGDAAGAAAEDSAVLLPPQAARPSTNAAAETVMQAARARVVEGLLIVLPP